VCEHAWGDIGTGGEKKNFQTVKCIPKDWSRENRKRERERENTLYSPPIKARFAWYLIREISQTLSSTCKQM
jgi:hypothetical protein